MKIIYIAVLLLAPMASKAVAISVGGVSLEIPNPKGFSLLTPQMAQLYTLQKQQDVDPINVQFAAFIPEKDARAALQGTLPTLPRRRFLVQTAKVAIDESVSASKFEEIKRDFKTNNAEDTQWAETRYLGSKLMSLPVHEETDHTIAMSHVFMMAGGERGVATSTVVHIKDKVLFLMCIDDNSDLEWTREASRQWARAIIAANSGSMIGTTGIIIGVLLIGVGGWAIYRRMAS